MGSLRRAGRFGQRRALQPVRVTAELAHRVRHVLDPGRRVGAYPRLADLLHGVQASTNVTDREPLRDGRDAGRPGRELMAVRRAWRMPEGPRVVAGKIGRAHVRVRGEVRLRTRDPDGEPAVDAVEAAHYPEVGAAAFERR